MTIYISDDCTEQEIADIRDEQRVTAMNLPPESRELCNNPFYAIGYAKDSLYAVTRALSETDYESREFALEWVRTAIQALEAVNTGYDRNTETRTPCYPPF